MALPHNRAPFPRSPAAWPLRQAAFSLIELIMVLVLAGIMAAVALPRMSLLTGMSGPTFRDELRSTLQAVRKSAIAARRYVCVTVSGNDFSVSLDPREPDTFTGAINCTQNMTLPVPGKACALPAPQKICAPSGMVVNGLNDGMAFDPGGRPYALSGAGLATFTINVIDGGAEAWPVTIEAETGLVH